jgi:hypothetical protein
MGSRPVKSPFQIQASPEKPLFDVVTEWAARDENHLIAVSLGLGLFSGGIFWLLWALG